MVVIKPFLCTYLYLILDRVEIVIYIFNVKLLDYLNMKYIEKGVIGAHAGLLGYDVTGQDWGGIVSGAAMSSPGAIPQAHGRGKWGRE
jgi:hypothetical protein